MHNQLNSKVGRDFIFPRARRGIHDHQGHCPIKACDMGRYGIEKHFENSPNVSRNDNGKDEVDNVMSKLSRSSPLRSEKKKERKKSLPSLNHQVTDDSDEECDLHLSKSLPTTLPSYYSDEYGNTYLENEINENSHTNSTAESVSFESNNSRNRTRLNSSNYSNYTPSPTGRQLHQCARSGSKKSKPIVLGSIVILLLGAVTAYYNNSVVNEVSKKFNYNETGFYHDMNSLAKKYKVTDVSILKVKSGLSSIFDRENTGCFIFLHNSQNNGYDEIVFDNFVENVATASARYLRNENDTPAQYILVDNLDMNTQSELINKYRHELQKNGVMLVKKLERIPSNLAMAFHYYCDEYNPLAKKSAVFFTLDLAKCSKTTDRKPNTEHGNSIEKHADVEKCLTSKWNNVPKDNIGALLTRVVSIIIDLSKVF